MWLRFNEVELARFLDAAIRDFTAAVGIIPAACVIRSCHRYYGFLWKIGQQPKFRDMSRHEQCGWMQVFDVEHIKDNEIYLLLYVHPTRVYALKYVIENGSVRRDTELIGGCRVPSFTLNEPLRKFKHAIW